jgi:hypothetical protein
MRDGDGLTQSGGPKPLAGKKGIEDFAALNAMLVFEQQRSLFENALLAGRRQVQRDISGWQQRGDSVHRFNAGGGLLQCASAGQKRAADA